MPYFQDFLFICHLFVTYFFYHLFHFPEWKFYFPEWKFYFPEWKYPQIFVYVNDNFIKKKALGTAIPNALGCDLHTLFTLSKKLILVVLL